MPRSSHINESGAAKMVDVSLKKPTLRTARAEALVKMSPGTFKTIYERNAPKGDVLGVARVAGIMSAKHVSDLIPMCHPISISSVRVVFEPVGNDAIRIITEAKVVERTGVEMEAMTAAAVAALTIYDMVKSLDRGMTIERIRLLSKTGGKSDDYKLEK
jgi:cyclic pyranopterin phosphate synthase